jgi:hypothetical protein
MANDANPADYAFYTQLRQFIQAKGTNYFVMGNPGTTTQEEYLSGVDALMTFENNPGYASYMPDIWVTNHLARTFCHVVYAVTNEATMTNDISLAKTRNAGWVYITDDTDLSNPYAQMPTYWTNEVNYVRALNMAEVPARVHLVSLLGGIPTIELMGDGGVYEIQASPDLASWTAVATVQISTNSIRISDRSATNSGQRFYRSAQ